ncbi:penicillin-binding protein 2 [Streptacidiphilus sp. PB12-B1b]|uniref:peptidoglycan D,D-transpeptidase FtsI family protein n=1 Tax=Streptacidiphilus sp. PB12-B1b TaxID=2705012 RepID=UPI0015FC99B8|nr:penicillin-binding protein 2 [Streptacidiphilus sp. PB12-B1b]QMU75907.1 penicillin-binding protein 2 [Streptacidiphilus sp. PB12-B1b]
MSTPRRPQPPRRPSARAGARPSAGARGRPAPPPPAALRLGSPKRRLRAATFALGAAFALFAGRLVQLQLVDSSALAAEANVNLYQTVTLPAQRGTITDDSGVVLATTVDAYDVTADPYMFTPGQAHIPDAPARAADLLAPMLGVDVATLTRDLTYTGAGDRYTLLAKQQSPQTWNQITAMENRLVAEAWSGACLTQNNLALKAGAAGRVDEDCANVLNGVFHQKDTRRVYPDGGLAANVLGFVNADGRGAGGLEEQYNALLAGRNGKTTYAQSGGQEVPTAGDSETAPVPGADIRLTLDRDIQWEAQQAITAEVKAAKAEKGYVIVQDVTNGRILAMATAPGFDPNDLDRADPADLGNPALQDAYEPGSVSKLMTMAAVLQQNVATPTTRVTVPGTLLRAGTVFHDDVAHGTEHLTLSGVLAQSSNIGTILAAEQLGPTEAQADRVLYSYLTKFGIGQPSGLGFPGETQGILAPPAQWSGSQQYTIPFGQGLSVNALQTTSVYSTIADGGVRIAPTLVAGVTGPDGRFVPSPAPARTRVVSEQTAKTLAGMLQSVVASQEGTGIMAQIPGYLVAGKTGTANRVDPQTGRYSGYTSSFIGFAPADRPRITVSCVVQDPVDGHFGGELCGPVFKQVMEFALKSLQVPPTGGAPANLPVNW